MAPPPVAVLGPTEIPEYQGTTNGELEDYVHALRARILECSADKRAALAVWPVKPSAEE
ncbi:Rz1-like lysis system protein LysC [Bradyrhizobium sp.]|uniref:Rz1-like lysis system protein LysC n=1 Tax=Bradyrhizobium sp. TaxID=376 RepID=UPI003D148A15